MNDEIKQLIEDAAKLRGLEVVDWRGSTPVAVDDQGLLHGFNPLDQERGDLMKVAEAADLDIYFGSYEVWNMSGEVCFNFTKGDYQSKAIAVLRAASAVLKARECRIAELDESEYYEELNRGYAQDRI